MQQGWLVLCILAAFVALIWLSATLVRLRLELWANRRVIAAFEQVGIRPEKKTKSTGVSLLYLSLFVLILWVVFSDLFRF